MVTTILRNDRRPPKAVKRAHGGPGRSCQAGQWRDVFERSFGEGSADGTGELRTLGNPIEPAGKARRQHWQGHDLKADVTFPRCPQASHAHGQRPVDYDASQHSDRRSPNCRWNIAGILDDAIGVQPTTSSFALLPPQVRYVTSRREAKMTRLPKSEQLIRTGRTTERVGDGRGYDAAGVGWSQTPGRPPVIAQR
ncbi:hypothetical protein ACWGK7_04880 [Sphingomonas aurantiaca]